MTRARPGPGLLASMLLFVQVGACSSGGGADPFVRPPAVDAGIVDAAPDAAVIATDGGKDDPTLGGPCLDDGQCDDKIACTFDRCDLAVRRCRNTPDDSQCGDGVFCNGRERCLLGVGCAPGPVETCQDQDACTVDTCIEATKSCAHRPRDVDGDGDPDDHCVPKHDCNDTDPDVASTRAEVCGNGKDDNCDGRVDETPCATPAADTCATALSITAPGSYALSTVAASADVALSCAATGKDVVAEVTIPAGGNEDLDVWVTATGAELALAVQGTCGSSTSELACRNSQGATRVRARNLAPGTYAVIVKTQTETPLELAVDFLAPTPPASNETCATAQAITPGTAFEVSLVDPAKDVPSACTLATGELTYSFTLAQPADVRAYASVLRGAGVPVLSLRKASCTTLADEIRCREDASLPLFARNLPAGNYVLTVGASASIDASVVVTASPPTIAPADESCATAPALTSNVATDFDLDAHDDDVADGCFEGNPDAAYALSLGQASDVLLVARFPSGDTGSVALDAPTCTSAGSLACTVSDSPARARMRNLAAGDYRVAVADRQGRRGSLTPLVRPTVAPVDVTASDGCGSGASLITIPPTGGFFVGDTSNAADDVSNGCDQGGAPGNADVLMRMDLVVPRRVVFDMEGSSYTTILSVREGALCPGSEVSNACYVGFALGRSFLDVELPAGTYWIVVDGFNGERGHFELDVRTLDP